MKKASGRLISNRTCVGKNLEVGDLSTETPKSENKRGYALKIRVSKDVGQPQGCTVHVMGTWDAEEREKEQQKYVSR